ncbi:MAG: superoxide dismutase family protein [Phycisphaeraceae bacterium]|nr:superoxide dismutase family protein [Phycisphaeraceae bacterium]
MPRLLQLACILTASVLLTGCAGIQTSDVTEAVAVLHPTKGNKAHGVVRFHQTPEGVKVVADIHGLEPNSKHGFHIHAWGDCTAADGTSAGGHYNPEGHAHGRPHDHHRHAGDLGNVTAGSNGSAHYELLAENISLVGMKNPILGRGVILHAHADDGGQPTGNAGPRIACGVIGIANPN